MSILSHEADLSPDEAIEAIKRQRILKMTVALGAIVAFVVVLAQRGNHVLALMRGVAP